MGDKIISLSNGLTVAYTTNEANDSSTVIAVNEDSVHQRTHEGLITSSAGYEKYTSALDAVAFGMDDKVVILEVNPNDIQEWNELAVLDSVYFDVTDFCPSEIRSKKDETHGRFTILSNCHGGKNFSQEVFTYAMTKGGASPRLPLSSMDNPTNICAFNDEILVATQDRIYGVSIWDNFNYWTVPLDQLEIDKNGFELYCNENDNTATIVGSTEGTQQKSIIKVRGDSGHR